MKRKAEDGQPESGHKRPNLDVVADCFRDGLFDTLPDYTAQYAQSAPYKHAVVDKLMNDDLLRSVRKEILDNIHFTPKETDIYKIHQSGDLANLDGLSASALQQLPSLLRLRDSLYSAEFRAWISSVSGAGLLSGVKTDMAVNLYVPGCHLLCHDDVIGSRRVSYILYLTDPDAPWQASWGGALRLYPVEQIEGAGDLRLPTSEWNKVIPPAWNQLSFFAVQPGESFHDVEEVYKAETLEVNGQEPRLRMAISGWFHIPQEGEEGYEPGLEEKLVEKSSLQQLQGEVDAFDKPAPTWSSPNVKSWLDSTPTEDVELTEDDLQFLLHFMTPTYLTPDTVEELNEIFAEESILQLTNFLNEKYAAALKADLQDGSQDTFKDFPTSRPPHKHHYQFLCPPQSAPAELDTRLGHFRRVLYILLPSLPFAKWLALVTGLSLKRGSVLARRFRKGLDYQLAQSHDREDAQLEYTLCVTPSVGWTAEEEDEGEETNGKAPQVERTPDEEDNPGGYELYMAGDDVNGDDDDADSDGGVPIPGQVQSQTGAGNRRPAKRSRNTKSDPAIYQAAKADEDDGILFSNPATWNTLSIVLRDQGTLKFVKYVSKSAPGDRIDFTGCVEVEFDDEDEEDE